LRALLTWCRPRDFGEPNGIPAKASQTQAMSIALGRDGGASHYFPVSVTYPQKAFMQIVRSHRITGSRFGFLRLGFWTSSVVSSYARFCPRRYDKYCRSRTERHGLGSRRYFSQ